MIPVLTAALMVRAARTLPASGRDVVALVARPRGRVVHVAVAPLTPSGRFIPVAGRTVCRARTRRLSLVPRRGELPDLAGRRVCLRCMKSLRSAGIPGLDGRPMVRDQVAEAFELLTPAALTAVSSTLATVEETHELGRVATVLFGLPTSKPLARRTPTEAEVAALHDLIHRTRRHLAVASMSDEDRAATTRAREQQLLETQMNAAQRRRADARDRAVDRRNRGSYLTPHERTFLDSA